MVTQQQSPERGEQGAYVDTLRQYMTLAYSELRALAGQYVRQERSGHTLQATALVHEVFLRLRSQKQLRVDGKGHFFAIAAEAMRRVLVDHARSHATAKRGGSWNRVTLDLQASSTRSVDLDVLALDGAITKLEQKDERMARVVVLRFFTGMTVAEVAEALSISKRTVEYEWRFARAWLLNELPLEPC